VVHSRDREALDQAVVRGSELLKQGKIAEAQTAFHEALALEPDHPRVLALLGLSYFRAGAFSDARTIYEQLVARAPADASHQLNLGLVYLKLNDAERAIAALETSRALDPSAGRAVSYLGLAYARAGRYAEAYRAFLIAGQGDLASEIESNLSAAERERIHAELGRPAGAARADGALADGAGAHGGAAHGGPADGAPRAAAPGAKLTGDEDASRTHAAAPPRSKPPSAPPARPHAAPATSETASPGSDALSPREPLRGPRPDPAAPRQPLVGASMISRAVANASPPSLSGPRTRSGGTPPRPLSDLATEELVRADDGEDVFEIGPGGTLIIRVADRVLTRLEGVHVTGGDLAFELATRRSRGHTTDEAFDYGGVMLHAVTGRGYVIAAPGSHTFTAVSLDDDILYLREDLVFAFESSLRWENGNVPGLRGRLPVVQFRGDGAVVLRLARPLVRVKLPAQGMVFIDADRLAGWIGRVIPRAVVAPPGGPLGTMCIECTGEGIVLVEPAADDADPRRTRARPPAQDLALAATAHDATSGAGESLDDL